MACDPPHMGPMIPFSILDLAPIVEGGSAADALHNARDLARHAERWGYRRFWMAEHHSMPGIASAATSVALAHVGEGTTTIRIGAGGIMLPNHAPLQIAEQFGTLESLYPGRIDLGLGRAPGTDQAAAHALRRNLNADVNQFPRDVVELMAYLKPETPATGARHSRRRAGHSDLDSRIEPVRRAARGPSRPALRLRLPFRAGPDDGGDPCLPGELSAFGAAGRALCHARLQCLRRGHGRGGGPARHLDDAGLRQPAHRRTDTAAAARGGILRKLCRRSSGGSSTMSSPARRSASPTR